MGIQCDKGWLNQVLNAEKFKRLNKIAESSTISICFCVTVYCHSYSEKYNYILSDKNIAALHPSCMAVFKTE